MGKVEVKVRHIETPDFAADERWMHEASVVSDMEVLGKWALYGILLGDDLLPDSTRDRAQAIYARLDFERRYRDGDFDKTEKAALSGPSKYDIPSQIFRVMNTLNACSRDEFSEDTLHRVLYAYGGLRHHEEYETLSGEQQRAVQEIILEVSQNLHERGATMSLAEG